MAGTNTSEQFQKDFILAVQTLKNGMTRKSPKVKKLLTDWLIKWATYLIKEDSEQPYRLYGYKQGQIVLVDFGFRIGNELGGRHYAVVLEKNSPLKSGTIFLAPISSYDPAKGEKAHSYNVDLGVGVVSQSEVGAEVLIYQVGQYSKMRIEEIKKSVVTLDKFNEIVSKIYGKIPKKSKN